MDYKLFVGVDISKSYFDAAVLTSSNFKEASHNQFANNCFGFQKFSNWILKLGKVQSSEIIICMEHTGLYALPLCYFLSERSYNYILESPLQIKESMGIKRGKSDKKDANVIARYVYLNRDDLKPSRMPAKSLMLLRNLLAYRERLIKFKVSITNSSIELKEFTELLVHQYILEDSNTILNQLKEKINLLDKKILETIESDAEINQVFKLATSVVGIGTIIGAYLIVFTNSFTSFDNWRKFSCYCGMAPFPHSSGSSIRGKTKVSSLANRKMKTIFTSAAVCAIQYDKELKDYYNRQVDAGKAKMSVLNVIRNKLISRVFAAVRRGTPYVKLNNHIS